jgi:ribosomal protein S18 acetylase RimI-like enzyme
MMLVQQISQPPTGLPPDPLQDDIHARVNEDAPPSVLQLGKAQWSATKTRSPSRSPSPSPSSSPATSTTTTKTRHSTSPLQTPAFHIRPATPSDAAQIAHLGSTVFTATFGFSIPAPDLKSYITTSYALPLITTELTSPSPHTYLVAVSPTSPTTILGFAQLTEHTTEPCLSHLPQDSLCELQRLYVSADAHGKGVGKALTRALQNVAREKGYRYMWLGVWEGNFVAQNVYERAGFARVGDHEFTMGRCVQIDWIMVKEL